MPKQATLRPDDPTTMLPTMQRNALRMLLDRRDFSPREVAAIDRIVLERAPRIGNKGIRIIGEWLRAHGLDLTGKAPPTLPCRSAEFHRQRRLDKAIAVIRQNGYRVVMPEDAG